MTTSSTSISATTAIAPARSSTLRYFSAEAASRLFLITTRRPENSSSIRCASAWNSLARLALTTSGRAPATNWPEKAISKRLIGISPSEGPLGMAALAFRRAIVPIDSHAWSDWVRQIGRRVRSG